MGLRCWILSKGENVCLKGSIFSKTKTQCKRSLSGSSHVLILPLVLPHKWHHLPLLEELSEREYLPWVDAVLSWVVDTWAFTRVSVQPPNWSIAPFPPRPWAQIHSVHWLSSYSSCGNPQAEKTARTNLLGVKFELRCGVSTRLSWTTSEHPLNKQPSVLLCWQEASWLQHITLLKYSHICLMLKL